MITLLYLCIVLYLISIHISKTYLLQVCLDGLGRSQILYLVLSGVKRSLNTESGVNLPHGSEFGYDCTFNEEGNTPSASSSSSSNAAGATRQRFVHVGERQYLNKVSNCPLLFHPSYIYISLFNIIIRRSRLRLVKRK